MINLCKCKLTYFKSYLLKNTKLYLNNVASGYAADFGEGVLFQIKPIQIQQKLIKFKTVIFTEYCNQTVQADYMTLEEVQTTVFQPLKCILILWKILTCM